MQLQNKTIIASYTISNSFGMVMYEVNDEYVLAAWSDEPEKVLKRKLYQTKRGFYFNVNGIRFYLDDFMRTWKP